MATIKQLTYNIKNLQGRGEFTDDLKLSDRQVEFIINHFRAEIAAQRYNVKKSVGGFYQRLEDLKLYKTNDFRANLPDVVILKTKEFPTIASSHKGDIVRFVGTRDEFMGFQSSGIHTYNIDLENPYVRNIYFTQGDFLYICTKNYMMLREVYIEAVFNNPRAVKAFQGELDLFNKEDWEYPIPDGLIGQLNNMIINGEYNWMHLLRADKINDGSDDKQ